MKKLIISILTLSNISFAIEQKCELPEKEGTCLEYSGEGHSQRYDLFLDVCNKQSGLLQEGKCKTENVIGRCLFGSELTTFYYSPIFDDYGAELTCNYSHGKYKKGVL